MRAALPVVIAGCWRGPAAEAPLANKQAEPAPERAESIYVMSRRGAGPFNGSTIATEAELQKLVPKHRVVSRDLGADHGYTNIVFDVFEGDERLYYVVPDDVPGWTDAQGVQREYSDTMFAVFGVSPKIRVAGRRWRVGQPFDDAADLDVCECWGNNEVAACYRRNTHLKVIFEVQCDDAEREGPGAMLGQPIARIMWKRALDAGPDVDAISP